MLDEVYGARTGAVEVVRLVATGGVAFGAVKRPRAEGFLTDDCELAGTRGTYGTVYGMYKTTVYLPDDIKRALEQTAVARGCTEAALIREALRSVTLRALPPRPRLPLFRSRKPRLAESADKALAGFGRR